MSDDKFMAHKRSGSAGDSLWREGGPGSSSDGSIRGGGMARPARGENPPAARVDEPVVPGEAPAFRRISNGTSGRRGPSYPAWEKPPSVYDYPRLRPGKAYASKRFTWPLVVAIVVLVAFLIVGAAAAFVFVIHGHGGVAAGSPSPSALASQRVTSTPTIAVAPTQTPRATRTPPGPTTSFLNYTVQAGDRLSSIARKFGISLSALIAANPELATDPNTLIPGKVLTIPVIVTPPPATPTASLAG